MPAFAKVKSDLLRPAANRPAAWNRLALLKEADAPTEIRSAVARTLVLDAFTRMPYQEWRAASIGEAKALGLPADLVTLGLELLATDGAAARQAFAFRPGDVFAVVSSPAFDIWAFEALVPLTAGCTVRILPRDVVRDAPALAREAERADVLHAVPALMRELVLAAREGHAALARPREVFVGGDADAVGWVGGAIFGLLEQGGPEHAEAFERVFGTSHGVDLAALCAAAGTPHVRVEDLVALDDALAPAPGLRVVEVVTDRTAAVDLDRRVRAAVAEALR